MRWRLEKLDTTAISGWVYDPDNPERTLRIVALDGDAIMGRAETGEERPRLAGQHENTRCGFTIRLDGAASPGKWLVLCVDALGDGRDLILYSPDKEAIGQYKSAYQSFGDAREGNSDTAHKLERLRLPDLKGLRLLDLGCNEGFFCLHALAQGAERVVGLDASDWFIEKARSHVPDYARLEAEGRLSLRHASWWEAPEERFDIILFLSAIHYEPRQKALLDFLVTRLAPDGFLVLECGVMPGPGRSWIHVGRSVDSRRYPTEELLLQTLLSGYACRAVGQSVKQRGDPVPRRIYFCAPRRPTVLVVRGPTGSGKTVLNRQLQGKSIPVVSSDAFLTMYAGPLAHVAPKAPLYEAIRRNLTEATLRAAARLFMEQNLVREFCREFAGALPLEEDILGVEGEIFSYSLIFETFVETLREQGVVVWDMTPGNAFAKSCE